VIPEGEPSFDSGLVTIAADGAITNGVRVTDVGHCCLWRVATDGLAYGVAPASTDSSPQSRLSSITVLDGSGARPGWPVSFEGVASEPTLTPNGRALMVASTDRITSHVFAFDRAGGAPPDVSLGLPLATVSFDGDTGGCSPSIPQAPVVAQDGTIYVYGEMQTAILALDPSLSVKAGWPYRPTQAFVEARPGLESEHEAGYCPPPVVPATGPDGSLVLPLQAASAGVGGSLVALDPDGRMRPGWPVTLERPGAEFWSVVVDADGTAFAVAFEPESGGTSSATVVAIAPDSTVRYTITIIEP
jgi:hypothetical protein